MTTYKVKESHYILGVLLPALLTLAIALYVLYLIVFSSYTSFRLSLLALAVIMFIDYFIALSHPQRIQVDETSITFCGLNRNHVYLFNEIKRINVRPTSMNKRVYLRINSAGLFKGRYWIHLDYIANGPELKGILIELMEERHPKLKNFNLNSFKKTK